LRYSRQVCPHQDASETGAEVLAGHNEIVLGGYTNVRGLQRREIACCKMMRSICVVRNSNHVLVVIIVDLQNVGCILSFAHHWANRTFLCLEYVQNSTPRSNSSQMLRDVKITLRESWANGVRFVSSTTKAPLRLYIDRSNSITRSCRERSIYPSQY
jgi:hypothetical protein